MQRTMFMVLGWGITGSKTFGPYISRNVAHERAKELVMEDSDKFDHAVVQLVVVDEELYHPLLDIDENGNEIMGLWKTSVRDLD